MSILDEILTTNLEEIIAIHKLWDHAMIIRNISHTNHVNHTGHLISKITKMNAHLYHADQLNNHMSSSVTHQTKPHFNTLKKLPSFPAQTGKNFKPFDVFKP